MTDYNIEVKVTHTVTEDDIDTLVEMAGYGISYWARSAAFADGEFTVYDAEDEVEHSCTAEELAEALVKIAVGEFQSGYQEYAADYLRHQDAGYIDADLADHVVQYAMLGDVMYG